MLALIDGDILLYRIAFTTEDESDKIAMYRMNKYIDDITFNAEASDYKLYLTDSKGNYRNNLYPQYKQNRVQPKPSKYDLLKEYLLKYEAAIVTDGQEADDALGIEQMILGDDSIICSIDKDLLMIPGWHYNFVKGKRQYVEYFDGITSFYKQLLTGDTVDNIPGLKGIGPKKASKILEGSNDEKELYSKVYQAYKDRNPDVPDDELKKTITRNGQLLWIRRKEGEFWQPPEITEVS